MKNLQAETCHTPREDKTKCLGFKLGEMKVKNKGIQNADVKTYYTESSKQMIAELYADDLKKFDGSFENSAANNSFKP